MMTITNPAPNCMRMTKNDRLEVVDVLGSGFMMCERNGEKGLVGDTSVSEIMYDDRAMIPSDAD